jgi:hypothetical protein
MPGPTGKSGLTDLPLGIFGKDSFAVQSYDLDAGVVSAALGPGGLGPSRIGHPAVNKTGSSIPLGSLVFINGWDTASGLSTMNLAAANFLAEAAQFIMIGTPGPGGTVIAGPCANNATGVLAAQFTLTGQNTNAATVGDAVWLSASVPGGYTLTTQPTAANAIAQLVGRVATKNASTGMINLEVYQGMVPVVFGSSQFQPGSVGAVALTANLLADRVTAAWSPVVAVTGNTNQLLVMPQAGTINDLRVVFTSSLGISGTNFTTVIVTNLTSSNVLTLAGSPANTTFTAGTAIVANTPYVLALTATGANLVCAKNDLVQFSCQNGGTLGAVLAGIASIGYVPS